MAEKLLSGSDEIESLFNPDLYIADLFSLLDEINSVIGGEFVLNNKTKPLSFSHNGHVVPLISPASGIKSFGVLQPVRRTDCVDPLRLMIWDEAEIH